MMRKTAGQGMGTQTKVDHTVMTPVTDHRREVSRPSVSRSAREIVNIILMHTVNGLMDLAIVKLFVFSGGW